MMEKMPTQNFEGWAILELMGHRRLGGFVTEVELAGHGFLRIDIPDDGAQIQASQFYPPSSVYCLTPTTEAMARAVALRNKPQPVQRWELPEPQEAQQTITSTYDVCHCGHDRQHHNIREGCHAALCDCTHFHVPSAIRAQSGTQIQSHQQLDLCTCGHTEGAHDDDGHCDFPECTCSHFREPDEGLTPF